MARTTPAQNPRGWARMIFIPSPLSPTIRQVGCTNTPMGGQFAKLVLFAEQLTKNDNLTLQDFSRQEIRFQAAHNAQRACFKSPYLRPVLGLP
jgi:hypothetical protein